MIIHVLNKDLVPFCGYPTGEPKNWPDDHAWAGPADANCHKCLAAAAECLAATVQKKDVP